MKRLRSPIERTLTAQRMTPGAAGGRTAIVAPEPRPLLPLQRTRPMDATNMGTGFILEKNSLGPSPLAISGGGANKMVAGSYDHLYDLHYSAQASISSFPAGTGCAWHNNDPTTGILDFKEPGYFIVEWYMEFDSLNRNTWPNYKVAAFIRGSSVQGDMYAAMADPGSTSMVMSPVGSLSQLVRVTGSAAGDFNPWKIQLGFIVSGLTGTSVTWTGFISLLVHRMA